MAITRNRSQKQLKQGYFIISNLNPVTGDFSDSELNAGGGQFDTTLEMNQGVP